MMGWQERIHSNPGILSGKPVIRGTRLSVEFLQGLIRNGWTDEMIFEGYPHLTERDLQAVKEYRERP